MAAPLVSIAMSAQDAAATLPVALASLSLQTYENWELLLIDDGSRDDTAALARRHRDPRIRVLSDGARAGLAARLNEAVAAARGELIARMDADDVCYPERLQRQVDYLRANPEVDLLAAATVVFASSGRPFGVFRVPATHREICARPWAGFYMPHPTWMGRARWFRAHRYDETSKSEDQALLLGAYSSSRFAALPEPLLGYRQDSIPLRKVWRLRYHLSRALVKNAPRLAPRGLLGQAAKAAFDTVAICTGLERTLLRHRARPISAAEAERWQAVWQAANEEAARRL